MVVSFIELSFVADLLLCSHHRALISKDKHCQDATLNQPRLWHSNQQSK
jgi:hypothetical protein